MTAYEDLLNMIRGTSVDHHSINPFLYIKRPVTQPEQHATGLNRFKDMPLVRPAPVYRPGPAPQPTPQRVFKKGNFR